MPIDPEDVRQHYAMLSDDELLAIERSDLTSLARQFFDSELERRNIALDPAIDPELEDDENDDFSNGEAHQAREADWMESAFPACAFSATAGGGVNAAEARDALLDAGVPAEVVEREINPEDEPRSTAPYRELSVMVPAGLTLKATSVLDKAIFNPKLEEDWKTQLESLSDDELGALSVNDICAGLMDRVERLRRAYKSELARRRPADA